MAVIGAGPAGLIAAETLAPHAEVTVFDRMPSVGRKFLMAGRGGLNLTHAEPLPALLDRYGDRPALMAAIAAYPPEALMAWAQGLGQEIFTGSSGRVFPRMMKSSPLLRAWLARLAGLGVAFRPRHQWLGWNDPAITQHATVLALGGASWPRLGSDGRWTAHFTPSDLAPLAASNMGFTVAWSDIFRTRFAGHPLKRITVSSGGRVVAGEAMITETGIEGGAIYALSGPIRDAIASHGPRLITLDLRPDLSPEALGARLPEGRGSQSVSNLLRKAGLAPAAIGLVQEALHAGHGGPLATLVKALPVRLDGPQGLARAISSAGGLRFDALDGRFMLKQRPGVFACGEMLDWEAPTGGYLLQACFSTGVAAAHGAIAWLAAR